MIVGIEYAHDVALASPPPIAAFRGLGSAAKIGFIRWQDVEPWAFPSWWPDSLIPRTWGVIDKAVAELRAAGFTRITLDLHAIHSGYCAPTYTAPQGYPASSVASSPPKDEDAWKGWQRFCRALCPRLASLGIEIVNFIPEWQSPYWFAGRYEDWRRLNSILRHSAIRSRLSVGMGFTAGGLLDDDPSDAALNARIDALPKPFDAVTRRAWDMLNDALDEGDFDVIDVHSLSAPSGIEPAVRRVRERLSMGWREIHVGDCIPGEPIVPSVTTGVPGIPGLVPRLLNVDRAAFAEVERRQVETMTAKLAAMRRAGVDRCHVGPLADWPTWIGFALNPLAWQGLTRPDGSLRPVCDVLRAAQP